MVNFNKLPSYSYNISLTDTFLILFYTVTSIFLLAYSFCKLLNYLFIKYHNRVAEEYETDNDEEKMSLDDRMKEYEHESELQVKQEEYFIVRLDGVKFSKFTSGFRKPADGILVNAMNKTMQDLLVKYTPSTAYTHSDEISLVFSTVDPEVSTHIYNGRIQKLCSIMASYCNIRFNEHLRTEYTNTLSELSNKTDDESVKNYQALLKIKNKVFSSETAFDARILAFATDKSFETVNYFIWRSARDCIRNCIESYARFFFGHKRIHSLNGTDLKELMLTEKNFDFDNEVPINLQYGTFAKRQLYQITTERGPATRTRTVLFTVPRLAYSNEFRDFLFEKYYDESSEFLIDNSEIVLLSH
jgi:tRNA(His) 5'-end guanylyltransferase